jgi:hypothetical protein
MTSIDLVYAEESVNSGLDLPQGEDNTGLNENDGTHMCEVGCAEQVEGALILHSPGRTKSWRVDRASFEIERVHNTREQKGKINSDALNLI